MLPSRYRTVGGSVIPGGFGSVLPVHDSYLDRPVMFKSMHDPANNEQLLAEIHCLSRARSRHVVEIYDVIRDHKNDVVGIIIEKLTGRCYDEFHLEVKQHPLDFLLLIYQIATALSDLHSAGIVHRDLKLDNMRESSSGVLKIFDFGISCAGAGYHTIQNRGTLVYAAPELYTPGLLINPAVDIYALGVCCWALATNRFPGGLLDQPPQHSGRCSSIDTVLPGLFPAEVISLLDECLNPDSSKRPTASIVSETLKRYLVRGQHKGIFVQNGVTIFQLSAASQSVKILLPNLGELRVAYDLMSFSITGATGAVFINNVAAQIGMPLPDSCVLTFGDFALGAERQWITFVSAYPELVV